MRYHFFVGIKFCPGIPIISITTVLYYGDIAVTGQNKIHVKSFKLAIKARKQRKLRIDLAG